MRRICVRYEDGKRVCFVPEAGEEFFSRDDAHRVVGMLHKGSEAFQRGSSLEGSPGTEKGPGNGAVRRRCRFMGGHSESPGERS